MRKIFLLFLFIGIIGSCTAQKVKQEPKKNKTMTPVIDKRFETFDYIKFNSTQKENPYVLREFLSDGTYIELDQGDYGKGYHSTAKDSFYQVSKTYYKNGNIKAKGIGFNGVGFPIGVWYEFDESGKLIKEINYDKFYDFTFEDIVRFCEKENIPLQKGPVLQSTGFHTNIRRGNSAIFDGTSWWKIEWLKKPNVIEIITLDGKTGKVLSRQDTDYINN